MTKLFRLRSKRVLKEVPPGVFGSVYRLYQKRFARNAFLKSDLAVGAGAAATAGVVHLLSSQKGFVKGCALMAGATFFVGGAMGIKTWHTYKSTIKHASDLVGLALFEASKEKGGKNPVADFLSRNKFVYVNGKREVVGSNMPRLFWVGWLKLKSKDVLSGRYAGE